MRVNFYGHNTDTITVMSPAKAMSSIKPLAPEFPFKF